MTTDNFNPPNSVWPNGMKVDADGYAIFYPLGTNKVAVPTSLSEWPKGIKLISPFVYDKDDKLVGFLDTKALRVQQPTTIYLSYEHIEADFSSIKKEDLTIYAPNATTKTAIWSDTAKEIIDEASFKYKSCKTISDIEAIDADYKSNNIVNGVWAQPLWDLEVGGDGSFTGGMFNNCTDLTSFSSDLPSLTNGYSMFRYCSKLTSFSSDLSSLTDATDMFNYCSNLNSFSSDLPNLMNAEDMFIHCDKLTSFSIDLPNLTNGINMFAYCSALNSYSSDLPNLMNAEGMFQNCNNLTSFSSDLSSLTSGRRMFYFCNNLTSFSSDLSSLTSGNEMFRNCKLDASSIKNIVDTINTFSGPLYLGIGCNDTAEDKNLFAQEVGYSDMTSLLAALQAKGWTVETQYNGRPTTTYGLRRPSEDTLPVFVKLEEVEEHADYTSEDGSKKYRLTWFHETTGSTDGYSQFNSIEEAIETLNIKPIEN